MSIALNQGVVSITLFYAGIPRGKKTKNGEKEGIDPVIIVNI